MPSFTELPLWGNIGIFVATGVAVWWAGTRLSHRASELSRVTKLGDATIGIVVLGVITSLPEVAVSVTGAANGAELLAANNLYGGLAFQVALLAVADAVIGRNALTSVNAEPSVILQGALCCLLLTISAIAITVGDVALPLGVGAWSLSLLPLYVVSVLLLGHARGVHAWRPTRVVTAERKGARSSDTGSAGTRDESDGRRPSRSARSLMLPIAGAAVVVLAAGFVATRSAEAIAEQTGLGASFVGAVFLAAATSLPELSTAIGVIRLRRVSMAFGDIFGTNLIDASLILLIDAVSSGPPVLNELGAFSVVAALLGVVLTMLYIVGLLERRDRSVLRMGWDSMAVLVAYVGGLVVLYQLR
jgi:cation:H+ antiporter